MSERIIREPECRRLTGLSRTTRWRLERKQKFPRRLNIQARVVAWRLSDVEAWVAGTWSPPTAESGGANSR